MPNLDPSIATPDVYISDISESEWITQIHALAAEKKIPLQQSADTIFISAPPEDRAALKSAAITMKLLDPEVSIKMSTSAKSTVTKSGIGIFAAVAVLAIGYYMVVNKS